MSKKFAEYSKFDLSNVNKEVLKKWQDGDIFHKSLEIREGYPSFVFYEGPPSANGMPGIHHVIARSIKDIFCRYKTMKGFLVNRKAGWDTHGLPVELGVEKSMGITKEDIGKKISVADYNAACRRDVMKFTKEWEDLTNKMGYWVDMENPYITYDNRYIETLWYLLKELYKKGLLYKGYTIQPYSPAAGTGLSSHELNQPGCYRDVKDTTCTAQFHILDPKPEMAQFGDAFFLAWTTTPWTLPSNTALCVGPNITYVAVQTYNPYTGMPMTVVLAKDLMDAHFNPKAAGLELSDYKIGDKLIPFKVVGEWKGPELAGMHYEQLIPWVNPGEGAFRVITGDYVTTEDGTGIVHIAPTFGADDDRVAKAAGVPPLMMIDKDGNRRPMVDMTGKFYLLEDLDPEYVQAHMNAADYDPWQGKFVKNAYDPEKTDKDETLDIEICMMLKVQNRVFRIEKHVHNYPHCWRTDKPVLYYPLDSWFIRTTACRDRMIELNNTINWKPQSTGTGRFGKWLENLQDWNLSRSRYWGTPLPIWRTEDGTEEKCIGSVEELYNEIEKAVKAGFMESNPYKDKGFNPGEYNKDNYEKIDLHRPYVDEVILVSESGKPMKRETDLIDVWFDSGAMPYAQIHYPFENKEILDNRTVYPADFIAEGVDQTRGWFFTLHALATMVFDSVAYKAVVSNGLVLDKNGNKMSKRLGNAVDPFSTIEQYGSDPLRWYMITNASPWDNIKFDIDGMDEVRRKFFGTLYNTYSFFSLYANVDGFDYSEPDVPLNERPEIDRWILSLLNTLVKDVDGFYDTYEPTRAGRAISEFVNDNLSNWYVRLNRRRFWGGGMTTDKLSAYQTLYTCLETIAKLMAPIAPFYADQLFCDLIAVTGRETVESVHLSDFPKYDEALIDKDLEERMKMAQDVSSMVLALRRKVNIKVRQPLQTIMVPVMDAHQQESIEAVKNLILNEVNVKELKFVDNAAGILVKRIKPDFKKLGPRYGKIMKSLAAAIQSMSQEDILAFEAAGTFTLNVEGQDATIERTDVEIISEDIPGWLVANEGRLTVALDITVTESLRKEGLARELVNRIQNLRKSNGYDITDKINVTILSTDEMDDAIKEFNEYIANQVLAVSVEITEHAISDATVLDFEDFNLSVRIEKE
ncbi:MULTISPECIES: isoleucine--tRNA ligase [Parabacteroides]|uniref:Isoleucine--tRNA ligase n=10 Tax=Parabacteroides goldsteinii TaxID=328812 RepID=A0A6G1Z8U6_9BACT|nr:MULTISPECIES: isoleucine--tRNA ligase [Parabacteroides]EOS17361.1 isoleucyl-tRNA synthetase [Parabacteroides goldsteinii dnLKV18]KAI4359986.1 Isoleucine--tRNA ligase [Parabacteroides sp. ASF519]MBF0763189.1 isoleucine--tRNA ligase [Parabacteroides goldsteinii]MDZ3928606.1 isoleucine--tRNA ligase [Parabacteroides goldsteinii]MRX90883.1 isoleucine--tRNA ligase [Parabacteroides goldsteinii]